MVSIFPEAILLPDPLVDILIAPVVTLTEEIKLPVMVNVLVPDDHVTLPVVPEMVNEPMVYDDIPVNVITPVPVLMVTSSVVCPDEPG